MQGTKPTMGEKLVRKSRSKTISSTTQKMHTINIIAKNGDL
jgi:hypothetical protein